jgi:hypothetical protein
VVSALAKGKPAGFAASTAYSAIVKEYTYRYVVFSGRAQLFQIATEAGGRWHPASRGHVCTYLYFLGRLVKDLNRL